MEFLASSLCENPNDPVCECIDTTCVGIAVRDFAKEWGDRERRIAHYLGLTKRCTIMPPLVPL